MITNIKSYHPPLSERIHFTCDEDLLFDAHLAELGRLGVDGLPLVGGHGTPLVDGVAHHVDNPTQGLGADGDHDGGSGVVDHLSTNETLGTVHGDGTDGVLSQVLGNLQDQLGLAVLDNEGVEDFGQALVELDVNDSTDDGDDLALGKGGGGRGSGILSVL